MIIFIFLRVLGCRSLILEMILLTKKKERKMYFGFSVKFGEIGLEEASISLFCFSFCIVAVGFIDMGIILIE